jgi:DNA-binding NarL/FixJ family response regulator
MSGSPGTIAVLLADDQVLVRAGFRMILEAEPDLVVCGEAGDGEQALAQVEACRPDVVLMDVRMPGVDGIEATRRMMLDAESTSKVIMLTTFGMDEYVYDALQAGASGFLLKDVPPEQLVDGIRAVVSGESMLSPAITRRLIESYLGRPPVRTDDDGPLSRLTPREREILVELAHGRSNAEIARDLVVSETTVKTHVARVLMKLALRDRVQAVIFAYEHGVVRTGA